MAKGVSIEPSSIEGQGVVAVQSFDLGERILTIDDSCVVTEADPLKDPADERYCDYPRDEVIVMQPPERHINHSCEPNSFVKSIGRTRHVFALRTLDAGEEITYDYRINNRAAVTWACACGREQCPGTVHADFFELPRWQQLEYVPLLESWFIDANEELLTELVTASDNGEGDAR